VTSGVRGSIQIDAASWLGARRQEGSDHVTKAMSLSALCGWLFLGGCVSHVNLGANTPAGGSSAYRCPATTVGQDGAVLGECELDTETSLARWNQSGTTYYPLPPCANGIHRIHVGGDVVLVECAAPATTVEPELGAVPGPETSPE
jgi:hypothetical protein